jgi:hypothetical protein
MPTGFQPALSPEEWARLGAHGVILESRIDDALFSATPEQLAKAIAVANAKLPADRRITYDMVLDLMQVVSMHDLWATQPQPDDPEDADDLAEDRAEGRKASSGAMAIATALLGYLPQPPKREGRGGGGGYQTASG